MLSIADSLAPKFGKKWYEKTIADFNDESLLDLYYFRKYISFIEADDFFKSCQKIISFSDKYDQKTDKLISKYQKKLSEIKESDFMAFSKEGTFSTFKSLAARFLFLINVDDNSDPLKTLHDELFVEGIPYLVLDFEARKLQELCEQRVHLLDYESGFDSITDDNLIKIKTIIKSIDKIFIDLYGLKNQFSEELSKLHLDPLYANEGEYNLFEEANIIIVNGIKQFGDNIMKDKTKKDSSTKNPSVMFNGPIGENAQINIIGENHGGIFSHSVMNDSLLKLIRLLLDEMPPEKKIEALIQYDNDHPVNHGNIAPQIKETIKSLDITNQSSLKSVFDILKESGFAIGTSTIGSALYEYLKQILI